jgi:hypothetical protein
MQIIEAGCRRRRPSHGGRRRRDVSSSHKSKPHPKIPPQMAPNLANLGTCTVSRRCCCTRPGGIHDATAYWSSTAHGLDSSTSIDEACPGVRGSNPCRQLCCTAMRARSFHLVVNDDGATPCGSGASNCDESPRPCSARCCSVSWVRRAASRDTTFTTRCPPLPW